MTLPASFVYHCMLDVRTVVLAVAVTMTWRSEPSAWSGSQVTDLSTQFKRQVMFLEKRLREARVASLAEDAILEAKAVVAALRRMLDQLAEHP